VINLDDMREYVTEICWHLVEFLRFQLFKQITVTFLQKNFYVFSKFEEAS